MLFMQLHITYSKIKDLERRVMEKIEWHIKNQNAKYKFSENLSKESSINISKEISDFLGAKNSGAIVTVTLRKKDFLLAFSKLISNLPLYYYRNGSQKAEFSSEFFEMNYNEIEEHFGESERIQYQIKLRINDESTTRYYLYRMDGAKNFILRDFLIGENSVLNFIKNDGGEIIVEPVVRVIKSNEPVNLNADNELSSPFPHTQPIQKIFYGVPGCGKSHNVDEIINKAVAKKEDRTRQIIRVVFHPDYTNSDFVGQIMPYVKDGIEYRFQAGPFTRILKHAYQEHSKPFFLVIEELNRGNAAAIFGDLFQLLDRDKNGFSTYSVNNPDIASFIMSKDDYHNDKTVPETVEVGGDKWILDTPIRLPPNLSILATMNTSDQNVFTLDNAFQRRWDMEYIPNKIDYDKASTEQKNQYDSLIGETKVKWGVFRDKINEKISDDDFSFSNAEDKQLGLFFIQADGDIKQSAGTVKEDDFANKVLKYLWNDVFKRNREPVFADGINTFGDLLLKFKGEDALKNSFKIEF